MLLMYYWDGSAISQAFDAVRARVQRPDPVCGRRAGAGSLACRAEPGDTVHSTRSTRHHPHRRDPYLFSFLCCAGGSPPSRSAMRAHAGGGSRRRFDLIVVDAFSSDAIPIHLLTREAHGHVQVQAHAHGMVVMHISNRHLELASWSPASRPRTA